MSFRKRNVAVSRAPSVPSISPPEPLLAAKDAWPNPTIPGVRPSPIDGRPTTSTGILSLDALLAGHAGLALGNSLLIEENGTTDFAGTLLRLVAAEGVTQEHKVIVVGVGESWGRELPGLVDVSDESGNSSKNMERREEDKERMKIAWRYERLGEFGAEKSRG
ncbi:PAXNEB-domain-containing protein [Pseudovirgaria hyperparasitica]|uniref:Elongator complex protein 4 n=1 Tax=Pseudovirgaria hyperparasitica TaxID=470096 RepID=A0A6A6VU15_9PEZI|nr:PAXNEB-domain-containing protein [Pseudovirgaria hyperparasitica]KAF2752737.1 PAXNEB-domain-containing protein [Pseudovirgaria hyperparasitica]